VVARSALKRFWRDERGATAVEVGLLIACIALAIVSAVSLLSSNIKSNFTKVSTAMGT